MGSFIKIIFGFSLLFLFNSCIFPTESPPEPKRCDGPSARVTNLIKIIPLQTAYNQGDEVSIKFSIPASNTFFSATQLNIFAITNVTTSNVISGFSGNLFSENLVTQVKGFYSQGGLSNPNETILAMSYFQETDSYELEVKVKLNRVGNYSFLAAGQSVTFSGNQRCNNFTIITGFEGANTEGKIEFVVQ